MNGKGDKMRPFNGPTYRDNFDRIFRKKRKKRNKNFFEKNFKIIAPKGLLEQLNY